METIEGNKLIAEFMGFKRKSGAAEHFEVPKEKQLEYRAINLDLKNMPYHSSWDWLMPVVEMIETDASQETGHNEIHITENTCEIFRMSYIKPQFKNFDSKSKITAVWKTVVQYIQWYNTITPNPPQGTK